MCQLVKSSLPDLVQLSGPPNSNSRIVLLYGPLILRGQLKALFFQTFNIDVVVPNPVVRLQD
jgi:hypothetical protein